MTRRYLFVSDLHLCDIENHPDGWKEYKHERFTFDGEVAELVERFTDQGDPDDERTLVLNGDIIDFDLVTAVPEEPPWPVSARERRHGMRATEAKSTWKLQHVLADHPQFVATLVRFIARGHQIVYVIGNHDPEFHFPGVREAFVTALADSARQQDLVFDRELVRFEPWFYYVPGEVYAEHGQQYDYYNSFRYVLSPIVATDDPPTIALPMGNLSNRQLMSQMGFFNPHGGDFILNVFRYLMHWVKHYAFTRRSLVFAWFFGSIRVLAQLLRTKEKLLRHPPDNQQLMSELATRLELPLQTLQKLDELKRPPITNRVYRMVREFWIDRLTLALLMTGGTIALALSPIPLWIKLMVPLSSFPLLFLIYEWFAHGETIFSIEREIHTYAYRIAQILPVKVVAFGHTHVPQLLPLFSGVCYVNTGTWAPITDKRHPSRLKPGLRNALEATFVDGHARLELMSCWSDGAQQADPRRSTVSDV